MSVCSRMSISSPKIEDQMALSTLFIDGAILIWIFPVVMCLSVFQVYNENWAFSSWPGY